MKFETPSNNSSSNFCRYNGNIYRFEEYSKHMWAYIVLFYHVILQKSAMKAYIFYLHNFSFVFPFAEKAVGPRSV